MGAVLKAWFNNVNNHYCVYKLLNRKLLMMKTSRSSYSLSSSGASDTSRKLTYDSTTLERPSKPKRPSVLSHITRRSKTTPTSKEQPLPKESARDVPAIKEPPSSSNVVKKKLPSTEKSSAQPSKMATLPRMFKPKSKTTAKPEAVKSSPSSSGKSSPLTGKLSISKTPESPLPPGKGTLTKNQSSAHDTVSPPVKRSQPQVSKTVSLSFNELKKQYQFCQKEAEDLRTNMIEMTQAHTIEVESMRDELYESDKTISKLKDDLKKKEAEIAEKNKAVSNLEGQCLKLELEKDRLLMVIECAQRDALTGEKIIPDTGSWQMMMDEAHSQTERFLQYMELMTGRLTEVQNQCNEQSEQIKQDMENFKESEHFFV